MCLLEGGVVVHGRINYLPTSEFINQEFQVPKMEGFLNLIRLFFGVGCPSHKPYIQLI